MWERAISGIESLLGGHLEPFDTKLAVLCRVAVGDKRGVHAPAAHNSAVEGGVAAGCIDGEFLLAAGFVGKKAGTR
jgi:hypothetical protein